MSDVDPLDLSLRESGKMLANILSSSVQGVDAFVVEVEIDITRGLPSFAIVGLPEVAVRESKDRVKAAVKNAGYRFPTDRITVNLAPADIKKEGSGFDLPIAAGILKATGMINPQKLQDHILLGELSLDSRIKPVRGALPIAVNAKALGYKGIILPAHNAPEAAVVQGIDVLGVRHLTEVVRYLNGEETIEPTTVSVDDIFEGQTDFNLDFRDVKGQHQAKASPRNRRCRRAQRDHDRPARFGENDAGQKAAFHPPQDDLRGVHRND